MKNKFGYNLLEAEKQTIRDALSIIESYGRFSYGEIQRMIAD